MRHPRTPDRTMWGLACAASTLGAIIAISAHQYGWGVVFGVLMILMGLTEPEA